MNLATILEEAAKALSLLEQGRGILDGVKSAVTDGRAAIDATTQAQLDQMLANEEAQTKAALADLRSAIAASRAG